MYCFVVVFQISRITPKYSFNDVLCWARGEEEWLIKVCWDEGPQFIGSRERSWSRDALWPSSLRTTPGPYCPQSQCWFQDPTSPPWWIFFKNGPWNLLSRPLSLKPFLYALPVWVQRVQQCRVHNLTVQKTSTKISLKQHTPKYLSQTTHQNIPQITHTKIFLSNNTPKYPSKHTAKYLTNNIHYFSNQTHPNCWTLSKGDPNSLMEIHTGNRKTTNHKIPRGTQPGNSANVVHVRSL